MPRCLIIAGPNGAGKTTFARTFLPREKMPRFLNTDLLAAGLSPLDPTAAQIAAGPPISLRTRSTLRRPRRLRL